MEVFKAEKVHAQQLLALLRQVPIFGQKGVLSTIIGEEDIHSSMDMQNKLVSKLMEQDNSIIFIAKDDDMLIGYLIVMGGYSLPMKHVAHVFIGVLDQYRRKGVGTNLFIELENWAKSVDIYRLELLVVSSNVPAISLFKKSGFEVEGLKKNSLKVGGHFLDEFIMAKILI